MHSCVLFTSSLLSLSLVLVALMPVTIFGGLIPPEEHIRHTRSLVDNSIESTPGVGGGVGGEGSNIRRSSSDIEEAEQEEIFEPRSLRRDTHFIRFGRDYFGTGYGLTGSGMNYKKNNFIRLGRENPRRNNFIRLGRRSGNIPYVFPDYHVGAEQRNNKLWMDFPPAPYDVQDLQG